MLTFDKWAFMDEVIVDGMAGRTGGTAAATDDEEYWDGVIGGGGGARVAVITEPGTEC